jgi:CRISPR-associated protein Cas1
MFLCVQEQGAIVQKRAEGIEVRRKGELLYQIPLIALERLIIVGYVQVSTQAMYALSDRGVDIVYLTRGGRVGFSLYSPKSDNVFLRLAQVKNFTDDTYSLSLSKGLVREKLNTQVALVRAYRWEDAFDWRSKVDSMEAMIREIDVCENLDSLRGTEGRTSRYYFECYAAMLKRLRFDGRSRRPAKDEANALLNLGYAFLANECRASLEACGFDPSIGFMHGVVYGRQSLALDVMEVFRANVVDKLVMHLANWGMIAEKHFSSDKEVGFRLSDDGFRVFAQQHETHMADEGLRNEIRSLCERLRHAVMDKANMGFACA